MLLRTLGGLTLEGSALTRPKPLLVLAYVALEGATPRKRLAELFFADAADPRDSLSTALRHLRVAGALLDVRGDAVGTELPTDAARLLQEFDAYRYRTVLEAYAGPFLDGLESALGVEAEEWLFLTREAIADRVRSAGLHLTRAAVNDGRMEEARSLLGRCVSLPGASELEADELQVVVRLAERTQLPELARLKALAVGYGLELDERAAEPRFAATATPLHRSTRFVGRGAEVRRVETLLEHDGARLVTLVGLGGVGKTRLAARIADRVAARQDVAFADGVVTVALESVRRDADVAAAVAERLALPPRAGRDEVTLAEELGPASVLLVLDNVEHLASIRSIIAVLLERCPALRVLATSRERLGIDDEYAVEVHGLSTDAVEGVPSDAAALFLDRATRVLDAGDDAELDLDEVEEVCRSVDGHPLGLELAAAMTRALSVAEVASLLRQGLDVLDGGPLDAPARHRAVRAALAPSWERLDAAHRAVVTRLVCFRGSFALDAATSVAAAGLQHLLRLVDQALLRSHGGGRGRFALHPLVREFVRERADPEVLAEAELAHHRFFSGWLNRAKERLADDGASVLQRVSADLPDIVQAIRHAFDQAEPALALEMTTFLVVDADYLLARSPSRDLRAVAERAAREAERSGQLAAAEALVTKLANARRLVDRDLRGSIPLYLRAVDLARRDGAPARLAMLHAIVGALLYDLGDEGADEHLEEARSIASVAGDDLTTCEVLQRVAYVAARRSEWDQACEIGEEAVTTAERLMVSGAAPEGRAASLLYYSLSNLGTCEDERGRLERSLIHRHRALEVASARSQHRWIATVNHDIAQALVALGRRDEARHHLEAARAAFAAVGADDELDVLAADAAAWGLEPAEAEPSVPLPVRVAGLEPGERSLPRTRGDGLEH